MRRMDNSNMHTMSTTLQELCYRHSGTGQMNRIHERGEGAGQ